MKHPTFKPWPMARDAGCEVRYCPRCQTAKSLFAFPPGDIYCRGCARNTHRIKPLPPDVH